ncbi:MAG: sulfite exporter TauE/SafE family protein [Acidobacteria bacterium]|nr:sulfite exporter TauE/SafE family protein [Acidobacteriota bacterium]
MELGDLAVVVLTLVVGFAAGVLSALLGVGGAVVTTPAVRLLGATPIEAVGSTVPAILPGAISGTLRYAREGLVDWRAALGLAVPGALTALVGALVSGLVDATWLMLATAGLMLWSGITVVRGGRTGADRNGADRNGAGPVPSDDDPIDELLSGFESSETDLAFVEDHDASAGAPRRSLALLVPLGAASGFVAGLLGVGGGIVMVPMLTGPLRIPMRSAVASSLVAVAIFSVPALAGHVALGHVDWAFAIPLAVGVVPGARVGARITIGASDRSVRRWFGILVVVLAVVYGVAEASALR